MWCLARCRHGTSSNEGVFQLKILPNGIAVIEGDTHLSKWVEDSGTLRIAETELTPFRKYIPKCGVVIDCGAAIGDHTVTYADWVDLCGRVYAFEPNPEAYECLMKNTEGMPQVSAFRYGLSDVQGLTGVSISPNAGASFLQDGVFPKTSLVTLDDFHLTPDFIKIDVEGYEPKVLRGAADTIARSRPVMLIEVNSGALERAGSSQYELLSILSGMDYRTRITDNRIKWDDPQYDVLCLPMEKPQ